MRDVVAASSDSGGAGDPRHRRSCGFLPQRSNYTPGGPGRIPPERSPGKLPPTAPRGSAKTDYDNPLPDVVQ